MLSEETNVEEIFNEFISLLVTLLTHLLKSGKKMLTRLYGKKSKLCKTEISYYSQPG